MRFLFITTSNILSHATMKRAAGMAPVLSSIGHDVTILLQEHPSNRALAGGKSNIKWVFFPVSNLIKERIWKRRFLSSNTFDVIYFNALGWRNAVFAPKSRSPQLYIMEHCELESAIRGQLLSRRLAMYFLEWWSLLSFRVHVGASRYLVDLMKRRAFLLGIDRNIIWSPYAVDTDVMHHCGRSPAVHDYEKKHLILHVGTVTDNYGAVFLLEGLARLQKDRDDWVAVFVGEGPALERCRNLTEILGLSDCIKFPGFLPEESLRNLIADSWIFLSHLNDTEQDWARCPSKLYYYIAKGRPVVTPDIGENRLALGESGFYYQPNSIAEFCIAASNALDCDHTWRPLYSRESATWDRRTMEFLRSLNSCLSVQKQPPLGFIAKQDEFTT